MTRRATSATVSPLSRADLHAMVRREVARRRKAEADATSATVAWLEGELERTKKAERHAYYYRGSSEWADLVEELRVLRRLLRRARRAPRRKP